MARNLVGFAMWLVVLIYALVVGVVPMVDQGEFAMAAINLTSIVLVFFILPFVVKFAEVFREVRRNARDDSR